MRAFLCGIAVALAVLLAGCWAGRGARTGGAPAAAGETAAASGEDAAAGAAGALPPEGIITQREPIPPRAWVRQAGAPVLHLKLHADRMEPDRLDVPIYQRVRILVTNQSAQARNLIIPGFRVVGKPLAPGEENYIEFSANNRGDFPLISDSADPELRAILVVR